MLTKPDYRKILTKDDFSDAIEVFYEVWEKTDVVREYHRLSNCTRVEETILRDAIIDHAVDIKRLKDFHEITEINKPKFWAYLIFWYCRRKPIQVVGAGKQGLLSYVNEFVITTIFSKEILEERGLHEDDTSEKQREFFRLLIYNLRYRNFNAQSLELALTGFCCQ